MPKLIVLGLLAMAALVLTGGARAAEMTFVNKTTWTTVTGTGTPDTVMTAPAFTADGTTTYRLEFYAPELRTPASAGGYITVYLYLDGTKAGVLGIFTTAAASAEKVAATMTRYVTPAAGSRTYSIRAAVSSGTGYVYGGDGVTDNHSPATLRVTSEASGGGGATDLDDLTDVTIVSPIDGAVLKYDESDSQWKVATDDAGGEGSSGPVTLSAGDRERLDLSWYGIWAVVGLLLVLMIAPSMLSVMRVTRGMADGRG